MHPNQENYEIIEVSDLSVEIGKLFQHRLDSLNNEIQEETNSTDLDQSSVPICWI